MANYTSKLEYNKTKLSAENVFERVGKRLYHAKYNAQKYNKLIARQCKFHQ